MIPKSFAKFRTNTAYFYGVITCPTFLVQSVEVTFSAQKKFTLVYIRLPPYGGPVRLPARPPGRAALGPQPGCPGAPPARQIFCRWQHLLHPSGGPAGWTPGLAGPAATPPIPSTPPSPLPPNEFCSPECKDAYIKTTDIITVFTYERCEALILTATKIPTP